MSEDLAKSLNHAITFDLIGGTSTGGIIAIMLGRLGMTVNACIEAYDQISQTAFTRKLTLLPIL
ncbi:uncharacterized protein PG998_002942 [Apiospora kogelbergensis]|uniref:uncharacterized protein n=1 Tax=Apiospora kogelbergensis TaxID=1337665 RepID=UPI00312D5BA9